MTNTVVLACILFLTFLFQSSKCATKAMEGFVIGGAYTTIHEYPHSVFLKAVCPGEFICGSSILNQRILITAAHCVYGCDLRRNHRIEFFAGSASLKTVNYKRLAKHYVIHHRYDEQLVINDIALILVSQRIPLGKNTKRVIIRRFFPDVIARVAGWGTINEDTGATAMVLKHVSQRLRSVYTCAKVGALEPGMFCAGSEDFYEDRPGRGDSGSALITNTFTAIGLVSFRIPTYPALMVYTNVSFYYNWVTTQAKNLYCTG